MNAYSWPGNIRELEHLLERAAIMATTPVVSLVEPLVGEPHPAPPVPVPVEGTGAARGPVTPYAGAVVYSADPPYPGGGPLEVKPYEQAERENILAALRLANYRIRGKGGAAELLNIKPTTLEAKMARMGINRNRYAYQK